MFVGELVTKSFLTKTTSDYSNSNNCIQIRPTASKYSPLSARSYVTDIFFKIGHSLSEQLSEQLNEKLFQVIKVLT